MAIVRRGLIVAGLLAAASLAWLWWTRPAKVDMAAYVPADSIVFIEAQSIPDILDGLTSTDAWRELAQAAGADTSPGVGRRMTQLIAFTGLGTSDAVVLARAQVAVAVLGFEAAEESDTTLKFSPRAALVAETHTSEWRLRAAVEKLVGGFAGNSLGGARVERKEVDGVQFVTWSQPDGGRRKVVAAVQGSVAVVGNDEGVVRACLDVRRGARPSLEGNEQLKEMRVRLRSEGALAFGFAPQGSAAKIAEVFAPAVVGGIASESHVQSVLATVMPKLINDTLGSVGWSSRAAAGGVEDTYFLTLPGDLAQRLGAPLSSGAGADAGAASLLPRDAYQVSRYDFRSPELAWRGLNAALSSQTDVTGAVVVARLLEALVLPYGVEKPREFLRACGTELFTARLTQASEGKVLVAEVGDREALLQQVRAYLGRGARTEKLGDGELLVSPDPERGAACFIGNYLITGSEDDIRACVAAHTENRSLNDSEVFKSAARAYSDAPTFALTLTDERDAARPVLGYFARRGAKSDPAKLEAALARRPYAVSGTRLSEGGFEKKTRSPFGLFGEVVTRFAAR